MDQAPWLGKQGVLKGSKHDGTFTMYFVWRYIFPILFAYQGFADDVANTMGYYTPYQHLRICAQSVFSPSAIVTVIGCPSPWYNGCYCRGMSDFSVIITSYISSFVNSACSSNQVDVSSVFSVYDGYCEGAGYSHPAANNAATTTLQGSIGAPTSTVLVSSFQRQRQQQQAHRA